MQLVECHHKHSGQAEQLQMKLEEKEQLGKCLLLLQLQEDPVKLEDGLDGQVLLLLLEVKLKRPRQVPKEKSEAGPGGSEFA